MRNFLKKANKIMALPLLGLVYFYRYALNPISKSMGGGCRFYPTCSTYAVEALKTHGLFYSVWLITIRLVKCGPFHPGGYDPVPVKKSTCECKNTLENENEKQGKSSGSS
jgi:putative membrane protein insertion efficiency factor